jgi:hypothetical protein
MALPSAHLAESGREWVRWYGPSMLVSPRPTHVCVLCVLYILCVLGISW